ncbi:MAG: PLP-dependent aminotransferase family protein [Lachnospiraceae bacterium]
MNELSIPLEAHGKQPLYEQIYTYIRNEIREGKLLRDEKLPSTRALAEHLQVSRSTVDLAYDQLLSEGYLESKPYKGYYVCPIEGLLSLQSSNDITAYDVVSNPPTEKKNYLYDFTTNGIDREGFPFATWRRICKNTLLEHEDALFSMGDSGGEEVLRTVIAGYLHTSRGVNCSARQIVIGAGNDYLLLLLAKILGSDRTVAMEEATYTRAQRTFLSCGYHLITVPMDESGMCVEHLEDSEADIAYVMPAHQYPMGIVMPIGRRTELLNWASQSNCRYIIEDDYDSEFRYKGKPIPSLQASDQDGSVIYIGTFSKSIAPAIRVSFMVLPQELLKQYESTTDYLASTVSRTDQMMLAEFLRGGYYERHLNKMRKYYKTKHDLLLSCLKGLSAKFRISGENAGLHILLHYTGEKSEMELVEEAKKQGVRVYGLSETCDRQGGDLRISPILLLGYGGLSEQQITEGTKKLLEAWNTL